MWQPRVHWDGLLCHHIFNGISVWSLQLQRCIFAKIDPPHRSVTSTKTKTRKHISGFRKRSGVYCVPSNCGPKISRLQNNVSMTETSVWSDKSLRTDHSTATCQAEKWRINSLWPITMHYPGVPVSSPIVIHSCPVIRPACRKKSICLPRCFFLIMSGIHPPENYTARSLWSTQVARVVFSSDG